MNLLKRLSGRRSRPECPGHAQGDDGPERDPEQAAYMSWVAATVGEHGWAISGRHADEQAPPWAYSVGLWLSCQAPELVVCGLPVEQAASVINAIGARVADGEQFGAGDVIELAAAGALVPAQRGGPRGVTGAGVLGREHSLPLTFRPVDVTWRATTGLLAISDTFYGMVRPPYLQVVWTDSEGRFPWDARIEPAFGQLQPMLWLPPDDNPPSPWTRLDELT